MMYGRQKAGKHIKGETAKSNTQFRPDADGFAVAVALAGDECNSKSVSLIASFCCHRISLLPLFLFSAFPAQRKHCGWKRRGESVKFDMANTHSTASQPCFNSLLWCMYVSGTFSHITLNTFNNELISVLCIREFTICSTNR